MRAAVLAVGSELLGSDRLDTNSLRLSEVLAGFGVTVDIKTVVGDEPEMIAEAVERLAASHRLLLVTGGLGPTQDDVTREAVARALGRALERNEELLIDLERRFASFGLEMPAVNRKQADVIAGAEVLANSRGTAPGLKIDHRNCTLFLFPGVPTELEGLVDSALVPWLEAAATGDGLEQRILKVACMPESALEQRLESFYRRWGSGGVALLPSAGEVTIRLTRGGPAAERRIWLESRRQALLELLGSKIFGEGADATLEAAVGAALAASCQQVVTAESCTGGLIAQRLTRIPGSSRYFRGSIVSYANEVKQRLLQVPARVLEEHGAVSRAVALSMAEGALAQLGGDLAVAVTGIAGPEGGSVAKPVGTVHLAVSGGQLAEPMHREIRLPGDRRQIRWVSSQWALDMLRRVAQRQAGGSDSDTLAGDEGR